MEGRKKKQRTRCYFYVSIPTPHHTLHHPPPVTYKQELMAFLCDSPRMDSTICYNFMIAATILEVVKANLNSRSSSSS